MAISRRLVPLAGAYIAANVVAGAVLAAAVMGLIGGPSPQRADVALLEVSARMLASVTGLIAILALAPTLIAGTYAERAGIRSPVFYGLAGAVIGVAALGIHVVSSIWYTGLGDTIAVADGDFNERGVLASILAIVSVAGLLGGLTYWAIAGRRAGMGPAADN
jgi:hypothetical protein